MEIRVNNTPVSITGTVNITREPVPGPPDYGFMTYTPGPLTITFDAATTPALASVFLSGQSVQVCVDTGVRQYTRSGTITLLSPETCTIVAGDEYR